MTWKKFFKWLKYTFLILIILVMIGGIFMHREGKRMYGGLTQRVDYTQFKPLGGSFKITNVNILSPNGERMIPHQTIQIDKGFITIVDSTINPLLGPTTIDGSGKYLIPGLIDTHTHLFQSPNDLLLYLANGVTEIRELIGEDDHLIWRDDIESGKRIGPKMFVASPRLGTFEPMEGRFMNYTQGYMNIKTADEAIKTVKKLHKDGYDGIKIYSQLNLESYLAITKTANSLGMPVFGHIPWSTQLSDIYKNGQSSIAHFEELMNALSREFDNRRKIGSFSGKEADFLKYVDQRSEALANNLIENDIAISSTLWLTEGFVRQRYQLEKVLQEIELEYENPGISEWVSYIPGGLGWLPEVNRYKIQGKLNAEELVKDRKYWETYGKACKLLATNLSKRGVKIMTGTDTNLPPTVPGFSLHDELISLNRAGMSTSQVLQSATAIPANWLKSNSGKILQGYEANLVLLDKNPLDNIENTKTINTVIVRGKMFDRGLLDKILLAIEEVNNESRSINIDNFTKK